MLDKSQTKFLMTQVLIQAGVVVVLALSAFAITGCAKKNTHPPEGELKIESSNQEVEAATVESPSLPVVKMKNGDQLLALILKDKALIAFLATYQKKNDLVCTRPASGQVHWECKTSTLCNFSLETTCVSNISDRGFNDELRRLSILGEANFAKKTYKIADPTQTAAESLVQKIKFEYQP